MTSREPSTKAGQDMLRNHSFRRPVSAEWIALIEELARAEERSDLARQIAGLKMAAVYPDGRPDRNGYAGGWNDALVEVLARAALSGEAPDRDGEVCRDCGLTAEQIDWQWHAPRYEGQFATPETAGEPE